MSLKTLSSAWPEANDINSSNGPFEVGNILPACRWIQASSHQETEGSTSTYCQILSAAIRGCGGKDLGRSKAKEASTY